jgi:hypothetical protein
LLTLPLARSASHRSLHDYEPNGKLMKDLKENGLKLARRFPTDAMLAHVPSPFGKRKMVRRDTGAQFVAANLHRVESAEEAAKRHRAQRGPAHVARRGPRRQLNQEPTARIARIQPSVRHVPAAAARLAPGHVSPHGHVLPAHQGSPPQVAMAFSQPLRRSPRLKENAIDLT